MIRPKGATFDWNWLSSKSNADCSKTSSSHSSYDSPLCLIKVVCKIFQLTFSITWRNLWCSNNLSLTIRPIAKSVNCKVDQINTWPHSNFIKELFLKKEIDFFVLFDSGNEQKNKGGGFKRNPWLAWPPIELLDFSLFLLLFSFFPFIGWPQRY